MLGGVGVGIHPRKMALAALVASDIVQSSCCARYFTDVLDIGGVESSWCISTRGGSMAVEMMGSGGVLVGIMS